MRVRIYHSVDERFMFRKWRPEAALKLVDDYSVPELALSDPYLPPDFLPSNILELIYRDQNAVDGSERNVKMRNRSLSVGDVVMLDERAFTVASMGFEVIDANLMRVGGPEFGPDGDPAYKPGGAKDPWVVRERERQAAQQRIGNGRGYVSDEDEEKFDRLLSDPFGRS